MSPTNPTRLEREAEHQTMEHALETYARTVDAVNITAIAIARALAMDTEDVPRILASAACRNVEKLMEAYLDKRARVDAGAAEWSLNEQAERRRQVYTAADDLIATLTEGLAAAQQIKDAIGVKIPKEKVQ